jgi:hypothetical protein
MVSSKQQELRVKKSIYEKNFFDTNFRFGTIKW